MILLLFGTSQYYIHSEQHRKLKVGDGLVKTINIFLINIIRSCKLGINFGNKHVL